jgi:peptidoglycan biosynthesis protein MviN/MurJ (putative lipid II flippase)
MIVGIASVVCYVVVAVPFARTIGLPALALANAAQNAAHAVILLVLLTCAIGGLGLRALAAGLARIAAAAGGMAIICLGSLALLPSIAPHLFTAGHFAGALALVAVVGMIGAVSYFALAAALHLDEARLLGTLARARPGRLRPAHRHDDPPGWRHAPSP